MLIPTLSASIVILYIFMKWYSWKLDRDIHKAKMALERNKQVYLFRMRILKRFGLAVYDTMPTYDIMLHSSKPLEAKYWIDASAFGVRESVAYGILHPLDCSEIMINPN